MDFPDDSLEWEGLYLDLPFIVSDDEKEDLDLFFDEPNRSPEKKIEIKELKRAYNELHKSVCSLNYDRKTEIAIDEYIGLAKYDMEYTTGNLNEWLVYGDYLHKLDDLKKFIALDTIGIFEGLTDILFADETEAERER